MENREVFLNAGGERYEYIPCLNDQAGHIAMLANLVDQHTQGWGAAMDEPSQVLARATALGASQ
jgi:ferrochelatase